MSRRDRLVHQPWETTSHAGLWLDKFIGEDQGNDKAKQGLVEQVSATREPDAYAAFFARWRDALQSLTPETQNGVVTLREAEVVGRMAVGLGAEGVLETAISLHRTYGVPVIPGSALKGARFQLCAQAAGRGVGKRERRAHYRFRQYGAGGLRHLLRCPLCAWQRFPAQGAVARCDHGASPELLSGERAARRLG